MENFKCAFCGAEVKGTGYTNHCPECLWSTHVDIRPGDRASKCTGLMKPHSVYYTRDSYTIVHKCLKCGEKRQVKAAPNDKKDVLASRMKPGPIVV